ncbi:MAG: NAD(P)-binding domain-containing protein [Acidimicrobiia bacterium]|nr:NAD(P)-binding domain-containing protein [Acidimicrobiia bacterium]
MLHLNADETRLALPMDLAIQSMVRAFSGSSETPLRTLVGGSLVMPGRLDDVVGVKVVSVIPGSPAGIVAVFGADGSPVGIVDGPTLTAIRTGAVCGLATSLMAAEEPARLAMLGAGAMARDQVEAVRAVRELSEVLVWSRSSERAESLAQQVGGRAIGDPDEAVAGADIVSCATPATSPLFDGDAVRDGAHVNAVGAFTPAMAELPPNLLEGAFVVVDDIDAAAAEAGDLIQAGRLPDTALREILVGDVNVDRSRTTVFKSVGIAAQDVAAAAAALERAEAMHLGTRL